MENCRCTAMYTGNFANAVREKYGSNNGVFFDGFKNYSFPGGVSYLSRVFVVPIYGRAVAVEERHDALKPLDPHLVLLDIVGEDPVGLKSDLEKDLDMEFSILDLE